MNDIISDVLEDIGDNELKHYGVKGMKWGVRKNDITPLLTKTLL